MSDLIPVGGGDWLQDVQRNFHALSNVGVGHIYRVIKTDEPYYDRFMSDHLFTYPDGTPSVFPCSPTASDVAIQAALDAAVEGRNDHILIQPSNSSYLLTAALTMSKKAVHLIGVGGQGYDKGATNAVRLQQNGNFAAIAVSDAAIEIAGLYLKNKADYGHITIAASSYGLNIHHNFFPLIWSASPLAAIECSGDGGAWGYVSHHNVFQSQAGDDLTCAALIVIGASATGARCNHNTVYMGDGNICTVGIQNSAIKGETNDNDFEVAGNDGGFGHCIAYSSDGVALGNRGTVADGILLTGGTAGKTAVNNIDGASGGAIDEA